MALHDLSICNFGPREVRTMIFLRLLSFLIAIVIPVVPPLVLSDVSTRGMPGWPVLGGLFGLSLISGTFLYIALLAPRMRRSIALRALGGLLLMLPAAVGGVVLWTRSEEEMLWSGGLLLAASVLMFISFVFPAIPDRRQRPMRKRDRQEPALP
ncbi:hypothetical protein [Massilia luteola]|uniref:hypothetical protein n=1 Tax=Massilia luteola TaxID=3081751 RepID=UPI002ACC198F|nr:hypothetical protein [Massilia sp. Gc5]